RFSSRLRSFCFRVFFMGKASLLAKIGGNALHPFAESGCDNKTGVVPLAQLEPLDRKSGILGNHYHRPVQKRGRDSFFDHRTPGLAFHTLPPRPFPQAIEARESTRVPFSPPAPDRLYSKTPQGWH